MNLDFLEWPFFSGHHKAVAERVGRWADETREDAHPEERAAVDRRCRELVTSMGTAGITRYCVRQADGGELEEFDARAICLVRHALAYRDGLADFAFAMQGLGSGALSLAASAELRGRYLPRVARGEAVAAFALSEPNAGSDVAAMVTSAQLDASGEAYVLDGVKTWISNGGIADFYCVFARTTPGVRRPDGTVSAQGISAFVVEPTDPGFHVDSRIDVIAPHPLATLRFASCRVPRSRLIGAEGEGFKIAMRTLDVFRSSVAAASIGFAERALSESVAHVRERTMFGRTLGDFQMSQAALADMATAVESAKLLTYRAAWLKDRSEPVTMAAAMAKLTATESAQGVIDKAVQLFGGRGVTRGEVVERLYREIRALRIYEGASEVQKLIIAKEIMKN